jgi:hypothetical protein
MRQQEHTRRLGRTRSRYGFPDWCDTVLG